MFKISPLQLSILIAVITTIMMYLDSALFDSKKSIFTYIKNIILCSGLTTGVFKIFCNNSMQTTQHSSNNMNPHIAEPMYHGMPSNY